MNASDHVTDDKGHDRLSELLAHYALSHQHPTNEAIRRQKTKEKLADFMRFPPNVPRVWRDTSHFRSLKAGVRP